MTEHYNDKMTDQVISDKLSSYSAAYFRFWAHLVVGQVFTFLTESPKIPTTASYLLHQVYQYCHNGIRKWQELRLAKMKNKLS